MHRDVGVGQPQLLERLAGDVAGRNPEAGDEAVGGLEVAPERPDVSRLQSGQHRVVHVDDLVGGQRPGGTASAVQIMREPLSGRGQGAGHRITGSDGTDVVLRVHPQHQPGVALLDRAPVATSRSRPERPTRPPLPALRVPTEMTSTLSRRTSNWRNDVTTASSGIVVVNASRWRCRPASPAPSTAITAISWPSYSRIPTVSRLNWRR